MGAFLTFALDEGGALVHVDDVAKGMKCSCHCPHCNAPLYAKNAGQIREHHFAHAHGLECEGAYESSLHLLAKEVLQETGWIMLPQSNCGAFPSGFVRIHNVEVEKWDEHYGFRSDVEGIMDNGERLLIEFLVSHKVDGKKRQTIVDNHLKCIEIDINYQALDRAKLKEFLTDTADDRKWIVSMPQSQKPMGESFSYGRNPLYENARDFLKEIFDEGTIIIHPYYTSFYHRINHLTFDRLVMMYVKSTQSTEVSNQIYCYSEVRKRTRGTYPSTSADEDETKVSDIPKDSESLISFSEPLVQKKTPNRG